MSEAGPNFENLQEKRIEKVDESKVEEAPEPTKIIEIGGKKFEVGPDLGKLNWGDMNEKIGELNERLKEGEKPWRVFTKEEYEELGEPIRAILKEELSDEDKHKKTKEYVENIGFSDLKYYWSSTENVNFPDNYALGWHTGSGLVFDGYKNGEYSVRCVREV